MLCSFEAPDCVEALSAGFWELAAGDWRRPTGGLWESGAAVKQCEDDLDLSRDRLGRAQLHHVLQACPNDATSATANGWPPPAGTLMLCTDALQCDCMLQTDAVTDERAYGKGRNEGTVGKGCDKRVPK